MLVQPPTRAPYEVGGFLPGQPTAGALVFAFQFASAVTLPASLTGSYAKAGTASTGTATFALLKNGVGIGSIVFTASAAGTFTFAAAVSFAAGDELTITAPNPQDATLANVRFTLAGTR